MGESRQGEFQVTAGASSEVLRQAGVWWLVGQGKPVWGALASISPLWALGLVAAR